MDDLLFPILLCVAISIVPSIVLFILYFRRKQRINLMSIVEAEIVDLKYAGSSARPIVRYKVGMKEYEVTSKIAQTPHPRIGKKINVYYDPFQPEKMIIDSFLQRGTFLLLLALFFFAMGVIPIVFIIILSKIIPII